MFIDKSKSLAEITGIDWGEPPESASFRLKERYECRRCQLKALNLYGLNLLLELEFENDADVLVPYALNRVGGSFTNNDLDGLAVFIQVMKTQKFNWKENTSEVKKVRALSKNWMNVLDVQLSEAECTSDSLAFYKAGFNILSLQNKLLENLVRWERVASN